MIRTALILAAIACAPLAAQQPLPPLPSMTVANVTAHGSVVYGDNDTVLVAAWSGLPAITVRPGIVSLEVVAVIVPGDGGSMVWVPFGGFTLYTDFVGFFWNPAGTPLSPSPGQLTVDSGVVGQRVYVLMRYTITG